MHNLIKLKDMLCEELEEYGEKGDLSTGGLDVVDKLAHTIKNLDKIIAAHDDGEYSGRYMPAYYYEGGRSYAARRPRRDTMGRYSRDGIADKLRELMHDAPDDKTREEIRHLADKMETM